MISNRIIIGFVMGFLHTLFDLEMIGISLMTTSFMSTFHRRESSSCSYTHPLYKATATMREMMMVEQRSARIHFNGGSGIQSNSSNSIMFPFQ